MKKIIYPNISKDEEYDNLKNKYCQYHEISKDLYTTHTIIYADINYRNRMEELLGLIKGGV